MSKKRQHHDPVKQEEEYVAFLKKRLESEHFKSNVSQEELDKTKYKYEKSKLKLRMLKGQLK